MGGTRGVPPMSHRYVTAQRLADLHDRLDDRDWSLVRDLRRVRVLSGLQVQQLHHGDGESAKQRRVRQLGRLSRWQVIRRLERRIGGVNGGSVSSVYSLDVAGQRLADITDGQRRSPWTPSSPFVRHALTVSDAYVRLRLAERAGQVELVGFDTEPDCWQHYHDHGGEQVVLKPDAYVVTAEGDFEHHAFVEIDLGTEGTKRIRTKMRSYADYIDSGVAAARHGVVPLVVWASPLPSRLGPIETIARSVLTAHGHGAVVCDTEALTGILCGGER